MKNSLSIIFSLLVIITFSSCSEKTEIEEITTSITISISQSNINLGESVNFSVIDNNGRSIQSGLLIYINNTTTTSLTYKPSTEGSYSIYAKFKGISSNVLDLEVIKLPPSSITITPSKNPLTIGETVSFIVNDNYGDDVTSESEIFIDNTKITGSTYTSTQGGNLEVYATYGQLESEKISLSIHKYTQKVLIEDYTGTWCGWCPRVTNAIELVLAESNNVVPVTIHCSSGSAIDPFNFADKGLLYSEFGITGFPTAKINRTLTWAYPENSSQGTNQVLNKLLAQAPLGIGISSVLSGGDLAIDIDMEFLLDLSDLKLVVYIVEDKLIKTQVNYTDLYGGYSNLVNFEHNHVLRHCITDLFGNSISSSVSTANNTYHQSFHFDVSNSDISSAENIYIVAFVVNGSTKKVLNVQEAVVNQTVTY